MAQYEMNLRDYWVIVQRRRLIIVATTLLCALLSFGFATQEVPNYQATAAVKYEQSTQLSGLLVEVLSYSNADTIETQVALITSYPILEEVAKRLGRLPETVSGLAGLLVHAIGANTFIIVRVLEPFWFFAAVVAALPHLAPQEALVPPVLPARASGRSA